MIVHTAKYLWNGGKLIQNNRTPRLGEHWPVAVLPYWRLWSQENPTAFQPIWGTIHDDLFWKHVCPHLSWDNMRIALAFASPRGNVHVFNHSTKDAIEWHVQSFHNGSTRLNSLVHPKVLTWMLDNKYLTNTDAAQCIENYALLQECRHELDPIYEVRPNDAYTNVFLQNWYRSLFRDFKLDADTQASIISDVMSNMGIIAWFEKIHPVCTPYLHKAVDIPLLHSMYNACAGLELENNTPPDLRLLHESLHPIMEELNAPFIIAYFFPKAPVNVSNIHPSLSLLMDLQPIEKPIDLYYHLKRIKQHMLHPATQVLDVSDFSL